MASPGLSSTWGRSDWSAVVIEALILESALLKSGATRVVTDARIQNVPRLLIHPQSAWVAELQEIPSDSGSADILSLVPRKIGNVISVSTESVEDASVDELKKSRTAWFAVLPRRSTPLLSALRRQPRSHRQACARTRCLAGRAASGSTRSWTLSARWGPWGPGGQLLPKPCGSHWVAEVEGNDRPIHLSPDAADIVEGSPRFASPGVSSCRRTGCPLAPPWWPRPASSRPRSAGTRASTSRVTHSSQLTP